MRLAAQRSENWVKTQVKKILNDYKPQIHYFMPSASMYGRAGAHDFICTVMGRTVTIETKKGNKIPTDPQINFANATQAAGGVCYCINEDMLQELRLAINNLVIRPTTCMGIKGHDFERYRK